MAATTTTADALNGDSLGDSLKNGVTSGLVSVATAGLSAGISDAASLPDVTSTLGTDIAPVSGVVANTTASALIGVVQGENLNEAIAGALASTAEGSVINTAATGITSVINSAPSLPPTTSSNDQTQNSTSTPAPITGISPIDAASLP